MTDLHNIDKLDRAILRRLQENGRQTYDVIGEQVGLSPSAVLRRVKRLEDVGIIERYVALIALVIIAPIGARLYRRLTLNRTTQMLRDQLKQSQGPRTTTPPSEPPR